MTADLGTLSLAAVLIGFVHCLFGPDHYVPFVAMSRVGLWSLRKTLVVTLLCGVGHVAGSALLGFVGIALGMLVFQLERAESMRGDLAGWLLTLFGAVYLVWGLLAWRSGRNDAATGSRHQHSHLIPHSHDHAHSHHAELATADSPDGKRSGRMTPWVLFVIFLFGPCEPLIPLLMYPAAKANVWHVLFVTLLFGLTTLITMLALVALIYQGTRGWQFRRVEPFGHAVAGLIVLLCGAAILGGL